MITHDDACTALSTGLEHSESSMNVSYCYTVTIVMINRVKSYKRFTKCVIGDKKESFREHKEMGWIEENEVVWKIKVKSFKGENTLEK